jgi:hypothetical protein
MTSPLQFRTCLALSIAATALTGLALSTPAIRWDGSWGQEEYRFTFRDRAGKPVEGVRLRVENEAGTNFYHFPVADYLPGQVPTSDAGGLLVFHHVPYSMHGGTCWQLFGTVCVGECSGPVYVCRFLINGREVHRVRYNDLVDTATKPVRRRWKWLTWPELQEAVFGGLEWDQTAAARLALFDFNGDGKIDREEAYAAGAAERAKERAGDMMAGRVPESEDLEFGLVERTVVVEVP